MVEFRHVKNNDDLYKFDEEFVTYVKNYKNCVNTKFVKEEADLLLYEKLFGDIDIFAPIMNDDSNNQDYEVVDSIKYRDLWVKEITQNFDQYKKFL